MKFLYSISYFYDLLHSNDNKLKYYYTKRAAYMNRIPISLLQNKNIKYIKYLAAQRHRGVKLHGPTIKYNYLDIIKYMKLSNRIQWKSMGTCKRTAAKRGYIEIFDTLLSIESEYSYDYYVYVASIYNQWKFAEHYLHKTKYRIIVDDLGEKILVRPFQPFH